MTSWDGEEASLTVHGDPVVSISFEAATTPDRTASIVSQDADRAAVTDPSLTDAVLTTESTSSIEPTSATLNGELHDMDGASEVEVWFAYRRDDCEDGIPWPTWTPTERQTLTSTGTFSETVEDIKHDEGWEVVALAETDAGDYHHGGIVAWDTRVSFDSSHADLWVATDGDDSNSGSFSSPFETVREGMNQLETEPAGTTLGIKGGTYNESGTSRIRVEYSGTESDPYRIVGFDSPIINLANVSVDDFTAAFQIEWSEYVKVIGLHFQESPGYGFRFDADLDHVEAIDCASGFHENTGFYTRPLDATVDESILFKRCEGYANRRPGNTDADGFGMADQDHWVRYEECIGHHNHDDGFDAHFANGDIYERCAAWRNGFDMDENLWPESDGFGWKGGGSESGPIHMYDCLMWDNERYAIIFNDQSFTCTMHNCTLVNLAGDTDNNPNIGEWGAGAGDHEIRNCHSQNKNDDHINNPQYVDDQYNNWNSETSSGDNPDVHSTDPTHPLFMHLTETSQARDDGTDVGREFSGSAPDLGCFDYHRDTVPLEDAQ